MSSNGLSLGEAEPAVTRGAVAAVISSGTILAIDIANARLEWLEAEEVTRISAFLALLAPIVAAILIRRQTTSNARVDEIAAAAGAAGAVEKEQEIHSYLAAARPKVAVRKAPPAKR